MVAEEVLLVWRAKLSVLDPVAVVPLQERELMRELPYPRTLEDAFVMAIPRQIAHLLSSASPKP